MDLFEIGMGLLIAGYCVYGKMVEKILGPDDRPTPATRYADGVDYVVLPHWKNMLIQLLNIAGIGPVIGVILGIKFGPVVFILIPLGNIFGGAVHDFVGAMMSMRADGANLPTLIRSNLGRPVYGIFAVFMSLLLILVVAVFINVPANLINDLLPKADWFWAVVIAIFLYYIAATLFPLDKIIGRIYPIFGLMLLVGTVIIFFAILLRHAENPTSFMVVNDGFKAGMIKQPIIPCLFVTIACGILSGFHATQSPIVVRAMETERNARATFYGMMVVEGGIAMIWAAAALALYTAMPETMALNGTAALGKITDSFLGSGLGAVTVIAVVVLAVTSGDTAMRSLRLSLAEMFHLSQKPIANRLLLCAPLIVIISAILYWSNKDAKSFNVLWNYFAWGNQVLAAFTLMAGTVWLYSLKKNFWITLLPGMFMTFVVLTFILWTAPDRGGPIGFGLPLTLSYEIAGAVSLLVTVAVLLRGRGRGRQGREARLPSCASAQK